MISPTFEQFRHVLKAGLSACLSGVIFWGFDIAGFTGEMPSLELYIRSFQMAAFTPVMQYHSMVSPDGENNEGTPWNVAKYCNSSIISICRYYANLRMNLLPYIYNEAAYSAENGEPLMRALVYDYPDDCNVFGIDDEYMFGRSILVAPVLEQNSRGRCIYLPAGNWTDFWDGVHYEGGKSVEYNAGLEKIPVFIKDNSVIPLNLNNEFEIGGSVGNDVSIYSNLTFLITGREFDLYVFSDELGNKIELKNRSGKAESDIIGPLEHIFAAVPGIYESEGPLCKILINSIECSLYKLVKCNYF